MVKMRSDNSRGGLKTNSRAIFHDIKSCESEREPRGRQSNQTEKGHPVMFGKGVSGERGGWGEDGGRTWR